MELSLTPKEAQILHSAVERYLDGVRDAYGSDAEARPLLQQEQDALEKILRDLHALAASRAP